MKFELNENHRGVSPEELLADLRSVAKTLGKNSVTIDEYARHGRYHPSTIQRKCGSWLSALKKAGLNRTRTPFNVPSEELLSDLKSVAAALGKDAVTTDEYDSHGRYYSSTLQKRFGSWFAALDKAGLQRTRILGVTDEEYFTNLEKVWRMLGRQPKYGEMRKPYSEYCVGAYEYRFGSWRKALQACVDFMNSADSEEEPTQEPSRTTEPIASPQALVLPKTSRYISLRTRFLVMRRDNFTCRLCGASPAKDITVELQVDHIYPEIRGGKEVPDNLQTLCSKCNLGKSDLLLTVEND
jgi:5-methylcytosine-specific restriction endonuclease McrA